MAAHMCSSSSSEDEDEKQRLQEAVFDVATCTEPSKSSRKDEKGKQVSQKRSLRRVEQEDEEAYSTGISGEVRDFVAKKLTSFLDSCITDLDRSHSYTEMTSADEGRDCGFRVFSSSDPAAPVNLSGVTPQVRRRRPVESSSSGDSDSEEEKARLAEAAVTHQDILQSSAPIQVTATPHSNSDSASTQEKVVSSTTNTVSNRSSDQSAPKKKKKKRKETSVQRTENTCASVNDEDDSEQKSRKKKKSKLKRKDLTAEELHLGQSKEEQENGHGEEESKLAQHSILLKKHQKKGKHQKHQKKKRKKIADDS
ncbi:uncharacterized protein LOC118425351 [Branchiostoma floridae]|uniref:Protein CUSTOS n=1 Tax=Branchiostoma floridae TaxID=7739 RepID=A0A9J7LXC9_BRAFL|nr:uncharacterized protein LOC118425351 [Branchiostoma floridae]